MDEQLKLIEKLLDKYKRGELSVEEQKMLDYLLSELIRKQESSPTSQRYSQIIEEYQFWNYFKQEVSDITHYDSTKVDQRTERAWKRFAHATGMPVTPMEMPSTTSPHKKFLTYKMGISIAATFLIIISVGLHLFRPTLTSSHELVSSAEAPVTHSFSSGGVIKRIHLSDGTVVHLNKETSLALRAGCFNAHTREVWLDEGEAFFEVAKDPHRPFIVHTPDGLSTKVLGTSFNIKAYSAIATQVVSVKTGRVQVESTQGERILLTPDTKVSYDPTSGTLHSATTDSTADAEWRSGRITFTSAGRDEVAMRLRQFYGVEMQVKGQALPTDMHLDSFFSAERPLKEFAHRIAMIYNANYKISDDTITFY